MRLCLPRSVPQLVFLALLACATVSLLHPQAMEFYRAVGRSAVPGFQDSSGHIAHFICYGTLSFAAVAFLPTTWRMRLFFGLLAHGISTELLQSTIRGRTYDPSDMVCNVLAIFIGFGLTSLLMMARGQQSAAAAP